MDARVAKPRPISIAVVALGGEGGGVLADWIVDLAQHGGYLAQTTSVPGVAQRTGATVYYVELFPRNAAAAAGREPVLALMPVPGDVDVVLASELMEAARAVERGFVTPDRTLLIASTHRVFAMTEKIALADGRVDSTALLAACRDAARQLVAFDMEALAEATGSALSAVLFGALAGSGALPFPRMAFEAAIRRGQVGVNSSLAAFGAGFEAARGGEAPVAAAAPDQRQDNAPARLRDLLGKAERDYAGEARAIVTAAIARLDDYQDLGYAEDFLHALERFRTLEQEHGDGSGRLVAETARQLALAMTYEDTIRVAELKIRASRFARVRAEVADRAGPNPRDRRVLSSARAGDRRHASGAARALADAHRLGPWRDRAAHAQGQDHQDHLDQRLPAALRARHAQAAAPPLAPLRRRAGGTGSVARSGGSERGTGLCAGAAGGANAEPGEGLRRYPRARQGQIRQARGIAPAPARARETPAPRWKR